MDLEFVRRQCNYTYATDPTGLLFKLLADLRAHRMLEFFGHVQRHRAGLNARKTAADHRSNHGCRPLSWPSHQAVVARLVTRRREAKVPTVHTAGTDTVAQSRWQLCSRTPSAFP